MHVRATQNSRAQSGGEFCKIKRSPPTGATRAPTLCPRRLRRLPKPPWLPPRDALGLRGALPAPHGRSLAARLRQLRGWPARTGRRWPQDLEMGPSARFLQDPGGNACPRLHLSSVRLSSVCLSRVRLSALSPRPVSARLRTRPIAADPSAPAQLDSEPSAQSLCQAGIDTGHAGAPPPVHACVPCRGKADAIRLRTLTWRDPPGLSGWPAWSQPCEMCKKEVEEQVPERWQ